ncbi:hypothetical protein LZL87_012683 [Fusarium oxysporum]|nr:hypothetical protein LZL87_012683 [Fusarium oxysporum]
MNKNGELIHISGDTLDRFVLHSALLRLIDPVRGKPTRSTLDENPDGSFLGAWQLQQKFLDSFALVCSTSSSGAETATAVCLETHDQVGSILRLARNHGLTPEDLAGLKRVLQVLQEVSRKEKPSTQAETEILQLVAELDKGRILSIAERIEKRGIRQFLQKSQSGVHDSQLQSEKFRIWLENCPFTASPSLIQNWTCATTVKLIHWASEARWHYAEQLRTLLKLEESQSQAWLDNLHKVARYHSAIKSMVKFAVKEPGIFVNIVIRPINAPNPRRFKFPNAKAPLLAVVRTLVGKDTNSTMEKLEKHLGTQDIEARLRRACRLELTLHAEMQIVIFYEGNPGRPTDHLIIAMYTGFNIGGQSSASSNLMETAETNANIVVGDHRDLLDIIDKLRLQGVSHYVDLPEIIVCGDQSAGKSSVLEAVSGMQFPIKDGLCTRFATELVLRRGCNMSIKVSITPGESRFGEDKERLENWIPTASIDEEGLGAVTKEAEAMMAITTGTGEFYEDTLRVELSGPEQPHLTMVDLPGLFRGGNKNQSDADISIVHDMVERYMARPRSIILTVVSAKYEYVLQEVTLMAKKADPEGLRTMGLITKPDTLDVGSPSEHYFVRLAQNIEAELYLGWHVLKNRSYDERDVTLAQRNDNEKEFLSQGLWSSIESSHCGVESLKVRLSNVLRDQILVQLPSLEQDVEDGILNCVERLEHLGPVRGTSQQQRSYLLRVSENYTILMRQAIDGTYTDRFFGKRNERDSFGKRLRAVVRLRLDEFAEEMRVNGQSQHIVDSASECEDHRNSRVVVPSIPRSEFISNVARRLKYNRGRELPGLFNPLIVNDLFIEQCTPWRRIAKSLADDMLDAVHLTTEKVVEKIAAREVSEGVLRLIHKEVEGLRIEMSAQIDALLVSATQHPITNNPQLVQHVQQTQEDRHKRTVKSLITKMFGTNRFDGSDKKISINPVELLTLAGEGFEPNMERFGSSLAVDYMKAFYKVAVNRFIDDVSVLAIEDCLIGKLPSLFTSSSVAEMSDEQLYLLAGETEESSVERKRLELKQEVLEKGLQDLKSLYKRSRVVGHRGYHGLSSEDPERVSVITQSKSENGSSITDKGRAASEVLEEAIPINEEQHPTLQADQIKWPDQNGMNGFWPPPAMRKAVRDVLGEDNRWGG